MTMMGDESFADFEQRVKGEQVDDDVPEGATAALPAFVPAAAKAPAKPPAPAAKPVPVAAKPAPVAARPAPVAAPPKAAPRPPPPARPVPPVRPPPEPEPGLPDEVEGEASPRTPVEALRETQALWGLKPPAEYVRFIKEKRYEQLDGCYAIHLQGGRGTQRLRFLLGASIYGVPDFGTGDDFAFHNADDAREQNPALLPFAAFDAGGGEIDSGGLLIDTESESCGIVEIDDGELHTVADSLSEFLAELTPDAPEGFGDSDDGDDDDSDGERGQPQHSRPGFRPKDIEGVEWDYVTEEGMGFNDDDDEDAMTVERNGKKLFKPDWGGWAPRDWVAFWMKHFEIEQSQEGGDDDFEAALKKHGLRNRNHWKRVHSTFLLHYSKDAEFTNAAFVARQEGTRAKMRDALKPGMLDPVEGVSLKVWAAVNAQLVSAGGDMATLKKLLAPHKIDEATWARASEVWNGRMSDQSNPDASMAIATEYGKAFAAGGAGAFGASAQASSESMGVNDRVAGKNGKGAEPVSFERWVEIQTAQGCWAQQGKDVNAMLKKVFGMTAVDWSNISAHWSQKLSTDFQLAGRYGELNAQYTEKYSAGEADPDGDLEV